MKVDLIISSERCIFHDALTFCASVLFMYGCVYTGYGDSSFSHLFLSLDSLISEYQEVRWESDHFRFRTSLAYV
jgi:hypothetical protein